jgi:hypothetical protein
MNVLSWNEFVVEPMCFLIIRDDDSPKKNGRHLGQL